MIRLVRVSYGKKDTKPEDREYRANGMGPCGCLNEWKMMCPGEEFEIIDTISGDKNEKV